MKLQYAFEIAALIILLLFLFDFLRVKKFPKASTKLLCVLITCAFLISCLDIANGYLQDKTNLSNVYKITSIAFYCLDGFICYFALLYILAICNKLRKVNIFLHIIYILPALANTIFTVLATFNISPLSFNFMEYVYGSSFTIPYVAISSFYVLLYFLNLLVFRKQLKKSERFAIILFNLIHIICVAGQTFMPQILLVGFARVCAIGIMYLTLERPAEYVNTETQLFNKTALTTSVNAKKFKNKPFSLIMVKLTNFHLIADMFSYEKQNSLFKDIALEIKNSQPNKHIFQADKYSLFITETKNRTDDIINNIQQRFNNTWDLNGKQIRLSANILSIDYPTHFEDISEAMDLLSYMSSQLKNTTLNGVMKASPEILKKYKRSKAVELALQNALMNKSLMVYYQPIHNAKTGQIYSAEALIRLKDSVLGFIPPYEFIEIAERTGSVVELGEFVFETCCKFIAEHVQNNQLPLHSIEINLSAIQCMQANLADKFINIMQKYNINPALINLELTETAITSSESLALEHMQKLKAQGVTFSCDDYGTGYSTCSYLLKFPFNQIKFDKTMIDSMFENKNAKVIVTNEILTLKELGFSIVAEGVEHPEQLLTLAMKNVDYIQGYYFSKPLSEVEFIIYAQTSMFNHKNNIKKVLEEKTQKIDKKSSEPNTTQKSKNIETTDIVTTQKKEVISIKPKLLTTDKITKPITPPVRKNASSGNSSK